MNTDPGIKLARIAVAASVMAMANSLPLYRPSRGELPFNGAFYSKGRPRSFAPSDQRAFEKRVAKRRAKKGYA